MKRRRNPAEDKEEAELAAWYAKQDYLPYPDDLPIPRRMRYGPQTAEVASHYLDADQPLPGTFPTPSVTTPEAAWIHYLDQGQIYPGAKLSIDAKTDRQLLIHDFQNNSYKDARLAERLLQLDKRTGFSPVFEFQYAVLNFNQWNNVLFFSLNGVNHVLHWDDNNGWNIDGAPFSQEDIAFNDFSLFDHLFFTLGAPYPVIIIKKVFSGDPTIILRNLAGPPSVEFLNKFGIRRNPVRRNPGELEDQLRMLEMDYFSQPVLVRRDDLKAINALRAKLNRPMVDDRLQEIYVVDDHTSQITAAPTPPKPRQDPHVEARALYQNFLEKEEMMRPYRQYCQEMLLATQPVGGQTPVMPLATMGTGGGPLLCDTCGKQIPLEGGKSHGVGAGNAWSQANNASSAWNSFILGGVTFAEETNHTFRVYHGYEHGCMSKDPKDKERAAFGSQVPYSARQQLDAFLLEERDITAPEERKSLVSNILKTMFGFDPGVGVNHP
jgi:hypothetical protein